MTYSIVGSLLLGLIGVVLWIEGGPHPRTRSAWLLLVAILIVSAMPALLCWLLCYAPGAPAVPRVDPGHAAVPAMIPGDGPADLGGRAGPTATGVSLPAMTRGQAARTTLVAEAAA